MSVSPTRTPGRAAVIAPGSVFVNPKPSGKTSHQVLPTTAQQTAFVSVKASNAASSGAQAAQSEKTTKEQVGQQLDVKL